MCLVLCSITDWAAAKAQQVTQAAPIQAFDHLPNWSSSMHPFQPVKETEASEIHDDSAHSPEQHSRPRTAPSEDSTAPVSVKPQLVHPFLQPCAVSIPATSLTAYPQVTVIRQDLEEGLVSLLDIKQFNRFLQNSDARTMFRDWMMVRCDRTSVRDGQSVPANVIKLDQWTDETMAADLASKLQSHAQALIGELARGFRWWSVCFTPPSLCRCVLSTDWQHSVATKAKSTQKGFIRRRTAVSRC